MFGISIPCLKLGKNPSPTRHKSCIFCNATPENGFDIVWEDETFMAFNDYKPAAQHHMLVIPKLHVRNIRRLEKSAIGLIQSMEKIGHKLLDDRAVPSSMRRMGFHISPFNSIDHLHLHVHGLPYKPGRQVQYPIAVGKPPRQKGLSWFSEVGQTIRILENGGRVRVLPC